MARVVGLVRRQAHLGWCLQCVDVFSLDIVELDQGVPHYGCTGGLRREPVALHPRHGQKVPLGAPLHLHICREKLSEEQSLPVSVSSLPTSYPASVRSPHAS